MNIMPKTNGHGVQALNIFPLAVWGYELPGNGPYTQTKSTVFNISAGYFFFCLFYIIKTSNKRENCHFLSIANFSKMKCRISNNGTGHGCDFN